MRNVNVFQFKSLVNNLKLLTFLAALVITNTGCLENKKNTQPPAPVTPEVVSISGGSVSIEATENIIWLNTQEILDNSDNPVKDGSLFVVKGGTEVKVSVDGSTFLDSVQVLSSNAKIRFAVKTPTQAGVYKVSVTQAAKQQKNAFGFFYIDVKPTIADQLGVITSSKFEDSAPYDGIKQDSEKYSALADGQTPVQIMVGPITDKYGNTLNKGYIRLVADKGQITSENPVVVSDGYVVFNYTPSTQVGPVNLKAQAVDEQLGIILKEIRGIIYQVKPELSLSPSGDMGEVSTNKTGDMFLTLSNNGTTSAYNINIRTILPFSLPTLLTDCPSELKPGQSCDLRVRVFSTERGLKQSEIQVSALPSTFTDNSFKFPIQAKIVAPASLTLSTNSFGFGNVSCGETVEQEFWIKNTGEADAVNLLVTQASPTNFSLEESCSVNKTKASCTTLKCRWSDVTNNCTNRYYDIVSPSADLAVPVDPNAVMNCGKTIPAGGRKCRMLIRYNPMALLSEQGNTARIQADGIDPVLISLSGGAGLGNPAGDIPINFSTNYLGTSSQASVKVNVGPVKDICGNKVDNNTPWEATVTSGSLSNSFGYLIDGIASFNWLGTNDISKIGTQSITVKSKEVKVNKNIDFTGSILSLSGNEDLGYINVELPQEKQWTVTNTGNEITKSITASFSDLQNVNVSNIDNSNCVELNPNTSCVIKATLTPVISEASSPFYGKINIIGIGYGQLQASKDFNGFGSQIVTLSNNSLNYNFGTVPVAVGAERIITIKSLINRNLMSYSLVNSENSNWNFTNIDCTTSIESNGTCRIKINYSNLDTAAGIKTAQFKISSAQGDSVLNFSINLVGNIKMINPSLQVNSDKNSLPADGTTSSNVTVGPVKDQYNNILPAGTKVKISVDKGTIVESQPLLTNSQGYVYATLKSSNKEIGKASVKAEVIDSLPQSQGYSFVTYTGVYLSYSVTEVDFGEVGMGFNSDYKIKLRNLGNEEAIGINFLSSNSNVFGLIDLGTCATGKIASGSECDLVVRFTAPLYESKSQILGNIKVYSLNATGTNQAMLNLKGISLIPATMVAENKAISIQLIPDKLFVMQVKIMNVGDAKFKNFAVSSDKPANLTISNYDNCNELVGGGVCYFNVIFNSLGIKSAFSSIITATADNTSTQINFTSDYLKLAFINENFTDDVLTCHPVQVQAQDSASNPMNLQATTSISVVSSKLGSFYPSKTCTGTTISKIPIYINNTTSGIFYFQPKIAGKHLLSATSENVSVNQENLAKLIIRPGTTLNVAPFQSVDFIAIGANGNVNCSYVLNSTGAVDPIPSVNKTCFYKAGKNGEVLDQIVVSDQDSPPNTAALNITTSKSINISPTVITINSGEQVQFTANNGSKTDYIYTLTPNQANKKIGSTIYNNIYTAGQNITDDEIISEKVTVTDSFGATASATVFVRKSVFKHNQIIYAPSIGSKSVAIWKNLMAVGDANATAGGLVGAGQVHIYKKDVKNTVNPWSFVRTIESPEKKINGHFGHSIGLFESHLIVGAPDENGSAGINGGGAVYYYQIGTEGNLVSFATRDCKYDEGCKSGTNQLESPAYKQYLKILNDPLKASENAHMGKIVSITDNFIAAAYNNGIQIFKIDTLFQPVTSSDMNYKCSYRYYPCKEDEVGDGDVTSFSIYNNPNYGGAYIAIGKELHSNGTFKNNLGKVEIFKRSDSLSPDWVNNYNDDNTLPLNPDSSVYQSNSLIGHSVAMFGPYLAVGAPGTDNGKGKVFVYKRDPNKEDNNWTQELSLNAKDFNSQINDKAGFGSAVAIFGNYLLVGASGEKNYPNLANSGSVYVFQRYLSEDNRWEYIGNLKASDYESNNYFGNTVALYSNNFIISSLDSLGKLYSYSGGKSQNIWPFGYHGSFDFNNDFNQAAGTMKDWSSFYLSSNVNYNIIAQNQGQWSYIGVAGDMEINGNINSNNSSFFGNIKGKAPDESGFLFGENLEYEIVQKPGGQAAVGTQGNYWYSVQFEQNGGLSSCSLYNILPFYANHVCSNPVGNIIQYNSPKFNPVDTGTGQTGGDGITWSVNNYGCGFSSSTGYGGDGGLGGNAGKHGQNIFLYIKNNVSGRGSLNVNGFNGENGADGQLGRSSGEVYVVDESNKTSTSVLCNSYCGNCSGPKQAYVHYGAVGGKAGGGGGGAGGSGGMALIKAKNIYFNKYNYEQGNGGLPGNGTNFDCSYDQPITETCSQSIEGDTSGAYSCIQNCTPSSVGDEKISGCSVTSQNEFVTNYSYTYYRRISKTCSSSAKPGSAGVFGKVTEQIIQ